MSTALAFANAAASRFIAAGRPEQAHRLLGRYLDAYDPATAAPDNDLAEAAYLWCAISDPIITISWATYAHQACLTLYPARHHRTHAAGELLAQALLARDDHTAVDILQTQLDQLTADTTPWADIVHARMHLAVALHRLGHCGEAIRHGHHAWDQTRHHNPDPAALLSTGISLLGMLTACDRTQEAHHILTQLTTALKHHNQQPVLNPDRFPDFAETTRRNHTNRCARHLDHTHDLDTPPHP